ncbi:Sucrose transport protein SUT5 (Sucrose permease 5) (Sucrose transporter 5) (OsSUT5) (Sucrose-proton symporter 5) [Durusdinium trenchii]
MASMDLSGALCADSTRRAASTLEKAAAQLSVALPELGWSVCEPLFMPLLLELEVPKSLIAICWVISPSVGFFLQPCVGGLSDKYGRRPFILVFSTTAVLGLVATPLIALLPVKALARPLAILAFGMADVSHDMLVTPTRAQMNDMFPPDVAESRSATVAGVAKIVAILCAVLLSRTAAFLVVATIAAGVTLTQLAARPKQRDIRDSHLLDPLPEAEGNSCTTGLRHMWQITNQHPGFWEMWMLQFAGWLSVCTWSFYFSSVWADIEGTRPGTSAFDAAVHQATQWLLYGSVVFLASGTILPYLSGPASICRGEWTGMFVAVGVMTVTLMVLCLAKTATWLKWMAVVWVVVAMPIAYQVLANAPFAWLERQPAFDAETRGLLTGIFNASLATSQATTALLSGPIVASFNGKLWTALAAAAVVDAVVLTGVALSSFSTWLCRRPPVEPPGS